MTSIRECLFSPRSSAFRTIIAHPHQDLRHPHPLCSSPSSSSSPLLHCQRLLLYRRSVYTPIPPTCTPFSVSATGCIDTGETGVGAKARSGSHVSEVVMCIRAIVVLVGCLGNALDLGSCDFFSRKPYKAVQKKRFDVTLATS